jgi:hypothetical protein
MERQMTRRLASPLIRCAITSWVCAAFLSALALSVSPRWHESIHPKAKTAEHECAVTLIGSGSYHKAAPAPRVLVPAPAAQFRIVPALHPVWVASPFLGARIFEHAPPARS